MTKLPSPLKIGVYKGMKRQIWGGLLLLLAILACNTSQPAKAPGNQASIDTIVAGTFQALSPSQSPGPTTALTQPPPIATDSQNDAIVPDGEIVSENGVDFLVPNGLASGAAVSFSSGIEIPYINPSLGDMPSHLVFTLNNYAAQNTILEPKIMIFKADEYASYSDLASGIISTLQNLAFTDGQPVPASLPQGVLVAQAHQLKFSNGNGIRYLTQFDQAPLPVNNRELFYYYHGLTSDGSYYIEAVLPIQAPTLPADENPNTPLPPGGISFNMDGFPAYLEAVTQLLNSTDTFSFTPYLDHIDSMTGSLQVTGF